MKNIEQKNIYKELPIKRKPFISQYSGKKCYDYYVEYQIKSDIWKAYFKSASTENMKDYEMLDYMYKNYHPLYLMIEQEANPTRINWNKYFIIGFDENNTMHKIFVIPKNPSDRNILEDTLQRIDYYRNHK